MDPPNNYPSNSKSSRKLSTATNINDDSSSPTAATTTPRGKARLRSLAENHRPNSMSASRRYQKQQGKDSGVNPMRERRGINNSSSQQQQPPPQQLPYNNMLLSGLNISTILASESLSFSETTAMDTTTTTTTTTAAAIPPRPRRLWKVVDTKLPKYPALYPPPSPYTSCRITNDDMTTATTITTPSVVAIRIAECLLRRNVCVEYDEEAVTATVLTVDRCVMQIHLWRPASSSLTSSSTSNAVAAAAAAAILVECVRTSGPVQTFHWTTQAVLQAAQGLDSGADRRRPFQASSLEYVRYNDNNNKDKNDNVASTADGDDDDDDEHQSDDDKYYSTTATSVLPSLNNNKTRNPDAMSAAALEALEYAYSLITKERLGAQQLGMEWLVSLTDIHAVGINAALYHALALLGGMQRDTSSSSSTTQALVRILYGLIVDKQAPNEQQQQKLQDKQTRQPSLTRNTESLSRRRRRVFGPGLSSFAASSSSNNNNSSNIAKKTNDDDDDEPAYPYQDHHASALRSMALRVLVNALTLLSLHQRTVLESLLLSSSSSSTNNLWTSPALIQALTDDLQGASRPPTVVLHSSSGRLASCHEACLAVQCLGVLARHNVEAQCNMLQNEATLLWLERARTVGRSTNMALYEQAEDVYTFLTETERSC